MSSSFASFLEECHFYSCHIRTACAYHETDRAKGKKENLN